MTKIQQPFKDFFCGKVIRRYLPEVSARNITGLKAFSVLGLITMSFSIVFGWLMQDIFTFNTEFLFMWIYFLIMYFATKFIKISYKHVTAAFYLWLTPLMLAGIILGTFGDPYEPSITIMVFLCVLPLFILDKPIRIVAFILGTAVIYTICCYLSKTLELFAADMIDLVLFTALGIGVNCLILRDRMDNVERSMKMKVMAETDALTELTNRGAGEEKTKALINETKQGMFLLMDLDKFKAINDTYGHLNGDNALKTLAGCLQEVFNEADVIMRFGGDEFAVFSPRIQTKDEWIACLDTLMQKIHSLHIPEMASYHFSVSIGVSFVTPENCHDFEILYHESDTALYFTKENGKDNYSFYQDIK